jgi:hypothetical protein
MRRVLAVLLALPALAAAQDFPQTAEEKQFYAAVGRAVYAMVPFEKGRFALGFGDRTQPAFPGSTTNSLEQVPCEKLAMLNIHGFATQLGQLGVAVCNDGARVRALSRRSRASLAALLKQLGVDEADARRVGWYYAEDKLAGGAEFYYFPVLLIGHGVLGPLTGALYESTTRRAIVVQLDVHQMCGEQFGQDFKDAPFCADARAALARLTQALRSEAK